MWLDVTMRHETCKTYAKKQLMWHRELRNRELEAYKKGLALPPNGDLTPLIVEAVKEKHRKYKPLLHLANVLQLKKRNYARLPVFVAGAVSHSGEMAPELITFIKWVTGYRRRAAKVGGALYDGAPSAWVAEEFRARFKAGIQTIIARTAGRIMASTGIPQPLIKSMLPIVKRMLLGMLCSLECPGIHTYTHKHIDKRAYIMDG
jgi:hypothetical protein